MHKVPCGVKNLERVALRMRARFGGRSGGLGGGGSGEGGPPGTDAGSGSESLAVVAQGFSVGTRLRSMYESCSPAPFLNCKQELRHSQQQLELLASSSRVHRSMDIENPYTWTPTNG
jgi:hypothetical protein